MPAKKPAKTQKQTSKPAASKAAAVKKKSVIASKSKAVSKPAAKPIAKPAKAAAKPATKTTKTAPKAATKPAAKPVPVKAAPVKAAVNKPVAVAKPAAKPVAKVAPAKSVKPEPKTVAAPKPVPAPAPAKPSSKPAAAPKAAQPLNPPIPIRSAVAVKSSVPVVKPKKDSATSIPGDAEDSDAGDSLSLLAGPRNVKPYQVKRDEEYMNAAQLDHFRTILQSWMKDLMTEVDRTVLHMKDEAANFPDPNDRATQESEFSLELRTRDRERKLIRKIEEALNRIEDRSYGYCVETGEEIGVKRLEARPVATLCVEAQERRERRERQYGDRDDRYR